MSEAGRKMTVGDLIKELERWPADWEVTFSGSLEFYRLKERGPERVNIEFNQTVWKDDKGTWQVT